MALILQYGNKLTILNHLLCCSPAGIQFRGSDGSDSNGPLERPKAVLQIRIRFSEVRIRILLSSSKNSTECKGTDGCVDPDPYQNVTDLQHWPKEWKYTGNITNSPRTYQMLTIPLLSILIQLGKLTINLVQ